MPSRKGVEMKRLTETIYKKGYCNSKNGCESNCEECYHFETMVDRLAYYEDLEEQGLLLRLPCKVGDTVWCIVGIKVIECTVLWTEWHRNGVMVFSLDGGLGDVVLAHLGERWFTTKEEAEQKLAEMRKE